MLDIRRCREDDYPAIARLLRQLWPTASINDQLLRNCFLEGLASDAHHFFCAEENGCVLGFCSVIFKNSLWQQGILAHINELVVDESARGHGIGTQLLENAIGMAARCGAARVELDSAFHRTEAHSFYQKLGFENRAFLFSKTLHSEVNQFAKETKR